MLCSVGEGGGTLACVLVGDGLGAGGLKLDGSGSHSDSSSIVIDGTVHLADIFYFSVMLYFALIALCLSILAFDAIRLHVWQSSGRTPRRDTRTNSKVACVLVRMLVLIDSFIYIRLVASHRMQAQSVRMAPRQAVIR